MSPVLDPEPREPAEEHRQTMKWFQYGQSMRLCEQLPRGFDFPLKQQSRICALQRQTPSLLLLLLLPCPCLSDVTEVDFIHVHKGSPTLESPGRRLLLVCAMVTTTNKGQSPMVMANWVCSHYWPSWAVVNRRKAGITDTSYTPTLRRLSSVSNSRCATPLSPSKPVLARTSLHHVQLLSTGRVAVASQERCQWGLTV